MDGYLTATTTCRPSVGQCDLAESCTGSSGACPADGFQPSTTACVGTSNGGACNGTDSCNGSGVCVDGYLTGTTTCRAVAGACDVLESCSGTSGACPGDGFLAQTTICRPATGNADCNPAESCTGSGNSCPTDTGDQCDFRDNPQIAPTGTTCQQYRDGTSTTLATAQYNRKGQGPIISVNPGVLFVYDGIRLATDGTITITETSAPPNQTWQRLVPLNGSQVIVYDLDCNVVLNYSNNPVGLTVVGNVVTISGVPAGDYILSAKYDLSALAGCDTTACQNTGTDYSWAISAAGLSSGTGSLQVTNKKQRPNDPGCPSGAAGGHPGGHSRRREAQP